jgi:hypothetical protein
MKKIYVLSIILLASTGFISCSGKRDESPDSVYRKTVDNPALGANSSLGEITPPISDNIKTSLDLFSPTPKKEQEVEEKTVPEEPEIAIEVTPEIAPEPTTTSPTLVRAPRIKADFVETEESPEAEVVNPVYTTQPVDELKIVNLNNEKPSDNIESAEVVITGTKEKSKAPIPASIYYKMIKTNKDNIPVYDSAKENAAPAEEDKTALVEVEEIKTTAVIEETKTTPVEEDKPIIVESTPIEISGRSELPPPDSAQVGQCYAKTTVFGETKEVEENILVKEASSTTIAVPAEYAEVEEEIIVKEALSKLVNRPTTYKTIEEEVVVTPEKTEEVIIAPAAYETVTERVLIHPARKIWKDEKNNGIMKLVEEPEEYKSNTRQILVSPEKREIKTIPAVTKTVKREVVDKEAGIEKEFIPAVTKKIKKQVLVSKATTKTIDIPAEYKTIKKTVQVTPDTQVWLPAICSDALDKDTTKRLQEALVGKGFKLKSVDGVAGKETRNAIKEFQAGLGFFSEGVALKTLVSLGIAIN